MKTKYTFILLAAFVSLTFGFVASSSTPENNENTETTNITEAIERPEILLKDNSDEIEDKIFAQNIGKLSGAEKTALKMDNYNNYKDYPQNFSPNYKRTFFYFLALNKDYNNNNPKHISDHKINLKFGNFMNNF